MQGYKLSPTELSFVVASLVTEVPDEPKDHGLMCVMLNLMADAWSVNPEESWYDDGVIKNGGALLRNYAHRYGWKGIIDRVFAFYYGRPTMTLDKLRTLMPEMPTLEAFLAKH